MFCACSINSSLKYYFKCIWGVKKFHLNKCNFYLKKIILAICVISCPSTVKFQCTHRTKKKLEKREGGGGGGRWWWWRDERAIKKTIMLNEWRMIIFVFFSRTKYLINSKLNECLIKTKCLTRERENKRRKDELLFAF